MPTIRFPTLLVLPATLWLAVSLGDENCSITRPGGVKEPGVTNTKGECCSSFYSNSGNAADCVPPTPGRADGARFYTSVSKHGSFPLPYCDPLSVRGPSLPGGETTRRASWG